MSEYTSVYEDRRGSIPVRLEATPKRDPRGHEYAHYRLVASDGRPGVVIVATRASSVLLVRSRRDSVGRDMWELPRGAGDPGDRSLVHTGRRELLEETGYTAEPMLLGTYVTDSTLFPHPMGVVRCEVQAGEPSSETDGEVDETRWFGRTSVLEMIADGTIADAHSLSALALWFSHAELEE